MMQRIFVGIFMFLSVGIGSTEAASDSYAMATASHRTAISFSYFGMHFHRLVLDIGERKALTLWPDQMVGSIRLWDSGTRWADIAPSAGQWKFERMDAYVEQAIARKAAILYVLGSTPRWASARQEEACPYGLGCSAEPVRMAHWEEYVRRVAQRYRGKISAYELWNEPFFSELKGQKGESDFFYGQVSKMVEMAKIARKVLDEVDPNAMLTTPGFTGNTNQLELFLSSGGREYVKVVAYHFYSANADQFVRQVLEVRAIMKRQGLENTPLWNTETGLEVYPSDKPLPLGAQGWSRTEAAFRMAQFLVIGAAAGLERYYYYAWDNERSGMFSSLLVRQPAWDSYEKVQSWLLNATMRGCESILPNGVGCWGERSGQRFLIVWAEEAAMHAIQLPSDQRVASVERLLTSSSQSMVVPTRSFKLMLGREPVRILLELRP